MSIDNQNTLPFVKSVKQNWLFCLLPYLALVLLHVVLTIKMQYPNISDEFGYLGRARYLAGVAHLPHNIGPYHFGYSLFLVPSFWLFSDPYFVYKAVLITNSMLLSTLYFPIYYILHTLLTNEKRLSASIAFVCCLYPAFILQSNLAWSESAFIPIYAAFIASFGAYIKHKSYPTLLLFSFFCGFLYTIHPRALPILPIFICYMCLLTGLKETRKMQLLSSVMTVACIYVLTNAINSHLLAMANVETANDIITNRLHRLFSPSNIALIFSKAFGQLLYLLLATYGLFFVGLFYASAALLNKWKQNRLTAFSNIEFNIFLLLIFSSLGIFVASTLQMLYGERGDHFFYGRYNEGFIALFLMLALLAIRHLSQSINRMRRFINPYLPSFLILILMITIVAAYGFQHLSEICEVTNSNVINVLGVYPFIGILRRLDIILISLISIPLIFLLMYAFKYRFKAGLGLLAFYFCVVSISGYTVFYVRASYIQQVTTLTSHIRSLGDVKVVSYDKAFQDADTWPAYQYLLQDVVFKTFNSAKKELPASSVVISGKNWNGRKKFRAKLVGRENSLADVPFIIRQIIGIFFQEPLSPERRVDQALWLLPEKAQVPLSEK